MSRPKPQLKDQSIGDICRVLEEYAELKQELDDSECCDLNTANMYHAAAMAEESYYG